MSKVIINHKIISSGDESSLNNVLALKRDNEISYFDNDVKVMVKILDDGILLIRKNNTFKINLEFKKDKSLVTDYVIKDLGLTVKLETKTKEIIIKDKSIYVSYDLFMNDSFSDSFTYQLEWRDFDGFEK